MGLTTGQIVFFYLTMLFCGVYGWWNWHRKDADFVNAFCGSFTFFGSIFLSVVLTVLLLKR